MDDPLILGIPDAAESNAPKTRFATSEIRTKRRGLAILPLMTLAWSALLLRLTSAEEKPDSPLQGNHDQARTAATGDADWSADTGNGTVRAGQQPGMDASDRGSRVVISSIRNDDGGGPVDPGRFAFHRSSSHSRGFANDNHTRNMGLLADQGLPHPSHSVPAGTASHLDTGHVSGAEAETPAEKEASLKDGKGAGDRSSPNSRTLKRAPVVTGPVLMSAGYLNQSILVTVGELLKGASDPDGDTLSVQSLSVDSGQLKSVGFNMWLYTPSLSEPGPVVFHYGVSDGTALIMQSARLDLLKPTGSTFSGTAGDDVIDGTAKDDLIDGAAGHDTLYGHDGNDIIYGGTGDDRILGGDGHDVIYGGDGNDILFGGAGNDTLFGEAGNDFLYGEDRNDLLFGGDGQDTLMGGEGQDHLQGDAGDDTLFGGNGDDTLDGGAGHDILHGDAGNDLLTGGDGNDLITGDAGNDRLFGDAGDDDLGGGAGSDTLDGGDGNDHLAGGAGDDTLAGGAGDDDVQGDAGNDTLEGGDGNDTLGGGAGDDHLAGGAGDNRIDGGAGDDTIVSGSGDDTILGGDGNDTISAGAGSNHVDAGAGDDTIHVSPTGGQTVVEGGVGNDTVDLSDDAQDYTVDLVDGWAAASDGVKFAQLFDIENVRGGSGNDRLVANNHVNILTGGAGHDTFTFNTLDSLRNDGTLYDRIADFNVGDRIDLSKLAGSMDNFADHKLFLSGLASASPSEIGEIRFEHRFLPDDSEVTVVTGHLAADDSRDFGLILDGHHELTAHDFILAAQALSSTS